MKRAIFPLALAAILAAVIWASCDKPRGPGNTGTSDPTAVDTTPPPPPATTSARADAGRRRPPTPTAQTPGASRYPRNSPVWEFLNKARPTLGQLDNVWFVSGAPRFVIENTLATAASVSLERGVSPESVQQEFCQRDKRRSCEVADILQFDAGTEYKLEQVEGLVNVATREEAVANCKGRVEGIIDSMAGTIRKRRGVIVVGYAKGAFVDAEYGGTKERDFHPFTVVTADRTRGIDVLDSAELEPLLYHIKKDKLCEFLAAPVAGDLRFTQPPPDTLKWGINVWRVIETVPKPKPNVTPDGFLDCGLFAVPPDNRTNLREVRLTGLPTPERVVLRIAVSDAAASEHSRWLDAIQPGCSPAEGGDPCNRQIFESVLAGAVRSSEWMDPLALLIRRCGRGAKNPKEWEALAAMRLVQEVGYSSRSERSQILGFHSPAEKLARQAQGYCHTQALLGAVLLKKLEKRSGVLESGYPSTHSAMLISTEDYKSGGRNRVAGPDGRQYLVTEVERKGHNPGDRFIYDFQPLRVYLAGD